MMYVRESGEGLERLLESVALLKSNRVLVGIPGENAGRGGALNNVQLAFIHANGSPKQGIPARPFLEPALEQAQGEISERMGEAARMAVEGDLAGALGTMDAAGAAGEEAARSYIGGGNLAPNAPITVSGGWMRGRGGESFKIEGKGASQPLVDSGSLRNSITHKVEGVT